MFFLIGFGWHVAASFAFVLAILTPNWITFQTSASNGNTTVQRGIFYICDLLSSNITYQTTGCTSFLQQGNSTDLTKWKYEFAISSASIAIGCAGLSIILIWLSGIYLNIRKKTKCTSCFLVLISLLLLLIFCASFVVWILLISETLALGYSVNRSIFNWPMWLAVGASGGYFMSFITMIISTCRVICCRRKRDENLYRTGNQF